MSERKLGRPLPDSEFRYWRTDVETRSEGEQRRIGGLGIPYNQRSRLLPGGFYEVVGNRAIAKSLGDDLDIVCRLEHDARWLLATTESRTLRITDNPAVGASYEADLPDTQAGRDAYELVRTGRVNHSSMVFIAPPGGDEFRYEGGALVRYLNTVRLLEISPVSQPGYAQTTTAVRSLARQVGEDPEDVLALAEVGELRSLFVRTDQQVAAPPTVEPGVPTPLEVAQRSVGPEQGQGELDLQRRRNALRAREYGYDPAEAGQRLLAHYRRKLQWSVPVIEARPQYQVVP